MGEERSGSSNRTDEPAVAAASSAPAGSLTTGSAAGVPPASIIAPATAKPNPAARLAGVLFEPVTTLRSIAERPDWIVPLIVLALISLGSVLVITSHIDIERSIREQAAARDTPPDQVDKQIEIAKKIQKFTAPLVVVFTPISLAIVAGVFLLAFRIFGGEGTFRQAFAVTVYSWLPLAIGGVVTTIIVATRGLVTQQEVVSMLRSNLGFLVDLHDHKILYTLLSQLDVFTIWTLSLFVIGYAFMSRLSRAASASLVIGIWLVVVLFKVAIAAIFPG
jgi:hypothetical protein